MSTLKRVWKRHAKLENLTKIMELRAQWLPRILLKKLQTVTLEENQVGRDTFDSELSISAGWPLPLEEKVDDKEVMISVAGMEVANKDEGVEVLESVHKAAKHVENVEAERSFDKGIVYPVADVDACQSNLPGRRIPFIPLVEDLNRTVHRTWRRSHTKLLAIVRIMWLGEYLRLRTLKENVPQSPLTRVRSRGTTVVRF